ncbi:Ig-like domain-containing protein [Saccharomonospora sp. NPDC046836]|uniref:Ig-like domain-containing protein n=1 Tax=Saccharomonospora sp. NPDC046836 TaxID=3156921 RepID=UPI00340F8E96
MRTTTMLRRAGVGALALTAAAAAAIGSAGIAAAEPPAQTLGPLTISPATGIDISAPVAQTSAGCPDTSDAYNMFVYGPGGWTNGLIATTTSSAGFSTTQGFPIAFGLSFKDIATDNQTTIEPGQYTIVANCVDAFSQEVLGTFTQNIWFTSPTQYTSTDPDAPITTSTALSVTPASPVTDGTPVTLTATVSPASATGTVQFVDGAGNLGSPVPVSGGTATLTTSSLSAGAHSLTAVFTGSAPNISGSTSPAVNYTVEAKVAQPTTTALSVNPSGTVEQYSSVTLNATVSPAGAAGRVQFTDNGANVGAPVTVSGGQATLATSTLAAGSHSLKAVFLPTNSADYAGSESAGVALEVTPFAGVTASETITTEVAAGELVISVANQNVILPTAELLPDASMSTTSGALNPVTVTDTRAGNPGWNVSGQVTDFGDGSGNAINGANLGWTPKVIDKSAVQTIAAGSAVNPAQALAPGQTAPAGVGLSSSRTLATAGAGGGTGTANLGGDLVLNVPTSTMAGIYTAVLTLTAI